MRFSRWASALCFAAAAYGSAAHANTVNAPSGIAVAPGVYQINNARDEHGVQHGLWMHQFFSGVTDWESYRWGLSSGTVNVTGTGIEFDAEFESLYAGTHMGFTGGFTLDAALDLVADPAGPGHPACQTDAACAGISNDDVDYFNHTGVFGTLTGTGSFAGWVIDLTVNDMGGMKPPQLGMGGSWFDANAALEGFATWMTWEVSSTGSNGSFASSGMGDMNFLLGSASNPNQPTPTPLPPAVLMLGAGIGVLAGLRRRKLRAAV